MLSRVQKYNRCSRCGSYSTQCYCEQIEAFDQSDEFMLHCRQCGFIERHSSNENLLLSADCPYCGANAISHRESPRAFWDSQWYKPDYNPLFYFDIKQLSSAGMIEFCIAEKNEQIILLPYGYNKPIIPLKLPVPYNKNRICNDYNIWDSVSLNFQIVAKKPGEAVIDVEIRIQQGCWFYVPESRINPSIEVIQERLIIFCRDLNNIKVEEKQLSE